MRPRRLWELAGGLQRRPPLLPLLLQHGKPLHQEIRERGVLQQDRSPFGRGVGQQAQTFSGQLALLLYSESSKPVARGDDMSTRTRSIRSPAALDRWMSPRFSK